MTDEKDWLCSDCDEYHSPRKDEGPYQCSQKGCRHDQLCIGCTFQCSSCEEDFCDRHMNFNLEAHLCDACLAKRESVQEAA